ncbi:hypothetical protein COLO4_24601 [Corchorus olitorius]|uniref:Phorbol-ester/DAG-type domain-containing protein n=1 Tax=Corchorus olitorius TaxID=93759 RepID=A0A1R3I8Z9_9ROSI|nr:hypothetical protein COLO4_24601 [Corchorus olitorius]
MHPLILTALQAPATMNCAACLGPVDQFRLVYTCAVNGRFFLHVDCAKPALTTGRGHLLINFEGHPHPLTFFDKTHSPALCKICGEAVRNCFFRCVACYFDMHLYCHPSAPNTITHKSHLHPLTLTTSPLDFELLSPQYLEPYDPWYDDDFYCDVCEQKRDVFESAYYCAEFKFIAEVRCVISELLPSLIASEDHRTKDKQVITSTYEDNSALEAFIAVLDKNIASLKAKKKPLELKFEKLRNQLSQIEWNIVELERDRFLWNNYQLCHNLKEKENPTEEASTSQVPQ